MSSATSTEEMNSGTTTRRRVESHGSIDSRRSDVHEGCDLAMGIARLARGDGLALHIPGYYAPQAAREMGARMVEHPRFGYYQNASHIGRVGMAYYEAVGSAALEETYFQEAIPTIRDLRETVGPVLSPIDRLRLELDESWPGGLHLLRDTHRRPAFVGLVRVLDGSGALPHVDRLEWDAPPHRFAATPIVQLAGNVYLKVPPEGGELAIWRAAPSREEHERMRVAGSYALRREELPDPSVLLRPSEGSLILFNARHVHAVLAPAGALRVSVSFFLLLFSLDGPLFIYS